MGSSLVIAILASLFSVNMAMVYDFNLSKIIADASNMKVLETQDSSKVLKFLQNYIAHRSLADGWKNLVVPNTVGFYYVSTVKLSSIGDGSCIMKKDKLELEYLVLDKKPLSIVNGAEFKSVPGVVYSAANTNYSDNLHLPSLQLAMNNLALWAGQDYVQKGLPIPNKDGTRNVQVGYSIVKGVNCGNPVGEFLLLAAYIE